MIDTLDPKLLVTRMSEAAAAASGRVPAPFRCMVDRTLIDVACVTSGGVRQVADSLRVDIPAVDAWRSVGVPAEFRARLHAMAVWPPRPSHRSAA